MPEIRPDAHYATFINTFRCDPADQDQVVQLNVDIVDQVASTFPGFISASVHRSTDGTRVFNYLQWETAEHLAAMQRSPEFQQIAGRLAGLIDFDPHQCTVVHVGEHD
ncbi:MAG TPA: antibiotic biosynthesis monooxygenase family protein [Solirubrobacteraceae bacterium]|jgi:quinol monooxygenase YgiN|nr:antibiotic biosynthesis monooxygenase family protein [Solirubrobacteraceae bacterium]